MLRVLFAAALLVVAVSAQARDFVPPADPLMHRIKHLQEWIVARTSYTPAPPPAVVFVSEAALNYIFFSQTPFGYNGQRVIGALYINRLILLADSFDLERDEYILLHEMVHHLQETSGRRFPCIAAREREAYELQTEWVKQTGKGEEADPIRVHLLTCEQIGR